MFKSKLLYWVLAVKISNCEIGLIKYCLLLKVEFNNLIIYLFLS